MVFRSGIFGVFHVSCFGRLSLVTYSQACTLRKSHKYEYVEKIMGEATLSPRYSGIFGVVRRVGTGAKPHEAPNKSA